VRLVIRGNHKPQSNNEGRTIMKRKILWTVMAVGALCLGGLARADAPWSTAGKITLLTDLGATIYGGYRVSTSAPTVHSTTANCSLSDYYNPPFTAADANACGLNAAGQQSISSALMAAFLAGKSVNVAVGGNAGCCGDNHPVIVAVQINP
jgi:hypothetical protein